MRMFLVGMCDVFLLLYLTTLSQLQERPASKLTVGDYRLLEQKQKEGETREHEREAELARREKELKEITDRLAQFERLAGAESEKVKRISESSEQDRLELERLRAEASEQQRATEESERRLAELRLRAAEAESLTSKAREEVNKAERERVEAVTSANQLRAEALALASERERLAAEAAEQARAAENRAIEAEQAAERAAKAETEARLQASITATRAQMQTSEANRLRTAAETRAVQAEQAALEESRHKAKAEEKFKAATQSIRQAYEKNILPKTVELRITTREDGFFGDSKETKRFSVLAVEAGKQAVAFVPLEQTGLDEPDNVNSLRLSIADKRVSQIYISRTRPRVLAVVLGNDFGPGAKLIPPQNKIDNYLPVLIAVRNGARMNFSDRMRDLSNDYYFFQRDRLLHAEDGAMLALSSTGFRGTGDFGERLVTGDQIVDPEGRFLGIVVDENLMLPIPAIERWTPITLDESGRTALKEIRLATFKDRD